MRWVFGSMWALVLAAVTARAEVPWQPVGLGGSGGMFCLAVSPLDPQLMMVNCDMSEAYLSHDAEKDLADDPSPYACGQYALLAGVSSHDRPSRLCGRRRRRRDPRAMMTARPGGPC